MECNKCTFIYSDMCFTISAYKRSDWRTLPMSKNSQFAYPT
jgi:hypothetical protein